MVFSPSNGQGDKWNWEWYFKNSTESTDHKIVSLTIKAYQKNDVIHDLSRTDESVRCPLDNSVHPNRFYSLDCRNEIVSRSDYINKDRGQMIIFQEFLFLFNGISTCSFFLFFSSWCNEILVLFNVHMKVGNISCLINVILTVFRMKHEQQHFIVYIFWL